MDRSEFDSHLENLRSAEAITVDTEGSLNHPYSKTFGLSTSVLGVSEYFPVGHRFGQNLPSEWVPALCRTIERAPVLIMHNAKHDLRSLRNVGIDYKGKFYDTMLMAHMVNENVPNKGLDYLSKLHGGEPKKRSQFMDDTITAFGWDFIPVDEMRPYAANDAYITEQLFHSLWDEFRGQGFDGKLWDYEQKWTRLVAKMEDTGILIDQNLCERELTKGLRILDQIRKELKFNPGSPKDLGKFLIGEMSLPVVKWSKKTGNPSFDKEAMKVYDEILHQMGDERAKLILTYRGWQKTTSSNYEAYLKLVSPEDGRLRPNFKLHGTRTGRMSCEHPNLQQIPRITKNPWNGNLKQAFITEPGRTPWEPDYSQLEFRLGAAYAREHKLLEAFNDDSRDVFSEMAADLGMSRFDTKTMTYTIQYGGGVNRVATVFGMSHMLAKARINQFYDKYPGLRKVSRLAEMRCLERGYVQYWTGRRRHFQFPQSEAHKAFNAAIQGGAFEIVKRRMIALDEAGLINDECRLDLQVHDSIRLDIEDGKEHIYLPEVKKVMENIDEDFGVRFKVDIHKWGTEDAWQSTRAIV